MSKLDCEQTDALLAARVQGVLEPADAAALDGHLAVCQGCMEFSTVFAPATEPVTRPFPEVDANAYELGAVLGQGSTGRVRLARDRRLGRQVALKELRSKRDEDAVRFVHEARIAASLQHPSIVPVHEVGSFSDGTLFYTMPAIDGRTLYEALMARSLVDRLALLPAVIAAADAVGFAHAKGVVHRDLTPANILLGDYGEAVVIDWGLAKQRRVDEVCVDVAGPEYQRRLVTRTDLEGGSPAYMPREVAEGQPGDERADVYAIGAILYHLLVGRPPYVASSAREVRAMVRESSPLPVDRVAPAVPPELVRIVTKAMARFESDRPTARELVGELRGFQAGLLARAHRVRFRDRWARWLSRLRRSPRARLPG